MSAIALRPYLPADLPHLTVIFRQSIEELTVDEYDADQREAWACVADDTEAFADRLGKALTIVATLDSQTIGFASLKDGAMIDMLYIHPDAVGQGAAKSLIDALEKLAAARGATAITGDISDTARGFFDKRGYRADMRNTMEVNGEWLANTTMTKTFAGNDNTPASTTRH